MNTRFLEILRYFAFGVLALVPIAFLLWSISQAMAGSFSHASDPSCDPPARCGVDADGDRGPAR